MLAVVDPNQPGTYPVCPSLTLFGVYCPLCGGLRGMHALAHGDVVGMLSSNLLLPLVLVMGTWGWLAWAGESLGRPAVPPARLSARTWGVIAVVAVVYTVLRNLAGTPFEVLAP